MKDKLNEVIETLKHIYTTLNYKDGDNLIPHVDLLNKDTKIYIVYDSLYDMEIHGFIVCDTLDQAIDKIIELQEDNTYHIVDIIKGQSEIISMTSLATALKNRSM